MPIKQVISFIYRRYQKFKQRSRLIRTEGSLGLYQTHDGRYYYLDNRKYLDRKIIETGVFEEDTTRAIRKLVKPGDVVMDIGANIGDLTVVMAQILDGSGKIYAFEPQREYLNILKKTSSINQINNLEIYSIGLSDQTYSKISYSDGITASLHWTQLTKPKSSQVIKLTTLDQFVLKHHLNRLDFLKIDVDGHEPAILKGGLNSIKKFKPTILLEVSHPHYLHYGITAWDFYKFLKKHRFNIYDEKYFNSIDSLDQFLRLCGNFDRSANILISLKPLAI